MKTKTYVLKLPTHFPKGHPREGEETEFAYSFMKALYMEEHRNDDFHSEYSKPHKIHAIRANYELWKQRIDEVNAGRAVLSVREWLGAPRRSKQRELFRFDRDSGIGVEKLSSLFIICPGNDFDNMKEMAVISDGNKRFADIEMETLAANDGLTQEDWEECFGSAPLRFAQPMAIIHFTKFRYFK